jgi:hypothetical protein
LGAVLNAQAHTALLSEAGDSATVAVTLRDGDTKTRGTAELTRDAYGGWTAAGCDPADWLSEALYETVIDRADLFSDVLPRIESAAARAAERAESGER